MQSVIQVHAVAADLTDSAGIAAACKEVEEALGPIDVLVNNAGMSREGPALSLREEAYDDVMAINTRAPYFLAQHVARQAPPPPPMPRIGSPRDAVPVSRVCLPSCQDMYYDRWCGVSARGRLSTCRPPSPLAS